MTKVVLKVHGGEIDFPRQFWDSWVSIRGKDDIIALPDSINIQFYLD